MKIRHIYTVIREYEIGADDLKEEIDFFNGSIIDASGEFLYSGTSGKETITVKMEIGD
jgi:hypothetical protein